MTDTFFGKFLRSYIYVFISCLSRSGVIGGNLTAAKEC